MAATRLDFSQGCGGVELRFVRLIRKLGRSGAVTLGRANSLTDSEAVLAKPATHSARSLSELPIATPPNVFGENG